MKLVRLKYLVKLLEDSRIFKFNVDSFQSRLKLQKYVFLAGHLGFNHGYNYNLYIHGPYSPELAKDYYELAKKPPRWAWRITGLDAERLVKLVHGKGTWWLEVAATALSMWERHHDKEATIRLTMNAKSANEREVKGALRTFEDLGMLKD